MVVASQVNPKAAVAIRYVSKRKTNKDYFYYTCGGMDLGCIQCIKKDEAQGHAILKHVNPHRRLAKPPQYHLCDQISVVFGALTLVENTPGSHCVMLAYHLGGFSRALAILPTLHCNFGYLNQTVFAAVPIHGYTRLAEPTMSGVVVYKPRSNNMWPKRNKLSVRVTNPL